MQWKSLLAIMENGNYLVCYHKFIYFNRTKLDILITNNRENLRLWGFDVRWRNGQSDIDSSKWTKNHEKNFTL